MTVDVLRKMFPHKGGAQSTLWKKNCSYDTIRTSIRTSAEQCVIPYCTHRGASLQQLARQKYLEHITKMLFDYHVGNETHPC